jgi:two-component system, sensor histidine kinase and response regulator
MATILIIEDEEYIRRNIAEIMTYEGFQPLEAKNGLEGVQVAQEYLPDLIICDIMMPELDGYGVLLELRSSPTTATIPFIFLTALADRPAMRKGMERGADDYLTKPFSQEELLTAVNVRLEKHAVAVREYEQKMEDLRGELISTLPHELRTPLTGVVGYSELLMMDGRTLDGDMVVKMATRIYESGQRLHRLTENYLMYAQIEIIRSDPQRVASLRKHMVENPVEIITNKALHKAAEFGREADLVIDAVEEFPVRISSENLQKITEELVDNALKFSEPGTPVHVDVTVNNQQLALAISDQGRGMTPEQIKNIGAYMQFERKIYEQQGSGLGLMIAKRLSEIYGGELAFQSTPGQFTTVFVTLPRA